MNLEYSRESIARRLPLTRNWLIKYNSAEVITLNNAINSSHIETLSGIRKKQIEELHDELDKNKDMNIQELDELVYRIPKSPDLNDEELKKEQRAFFKDVYNLLIGKDTGPRLGTFLWAADRQQVLKLLDIV